MLVLTRGSQEGVVITIPDGRRIGVQVVTFRDGKVRLGFTADRDIQIHRHEIQAEIDRQGHAPNGGTDADD